MKTNYSIDKWIMSVILGIKNNLFNIFPIFNNIEIFFIHHTIHSEINYIIKRYIQARMNAPIKYMNNVIY